jgi:hypothetical protein
VREERQEFKSTNQAPKCLDAEFPARNSLAQKGSIQDTKLPPINRIIAAEFVSAMPAQSSQETTWLKIIVQGCRCNARRLRSSQLTWLLEHRTATHALTGRLARTMTWNLFIVVRGFLLATATPLS